MPAELSTPQVAPFAVTRHWSSQLDDQATTAQSLLGPPATFKDNPGPAYIWRSDDRDRNIGALQVRYKPQCRARVFAGELIDLRFCSWKAMPSLSGPPVAASERT